MPQLIVRQIEEQIVKKLKKQAEGHGVSMEEEHRRILRESLLGKSAKRTSFKEALRAMPNVGDDADFSRDEEGFRKTGVHVVNPFPKSRSKGN
jgi:plasmid stability protein